MLWHKLFVNILDSHISILPMQIICQGCRMKSHNCCYRKSTATSKNFQNFEVYYFCMIQLKKKKKKKMVRIISTQDRLRFVIIIPSKTVFQKDDEQKNLIMYEQNVNGKSYMETLNMKNLKKKLVYLWQGLLTFLCYSHLLTLLGIRINATYLCQ